MKQNNLRLKYTQSFYDDNLIHTKDGTFPFVTCMRREKKRKKNIMRLFLLYVKNEMHAQASQYKLQSFYMSLTDIFIHCSNRFDCS